MRRCHPFFLLLLLLVGCAGSGDFAMLVPIAGGEKLRVPLSGGGPPPARNDAIQITTAGLEPSPEPEAVVYRFGFKLLKPLDIRRVTVQDVAGDRSIVLVEDGSPQIDGGEWKGASPLLRGRDERLTWVYHLENSVRVYRFTIETTDGRTLVLQQPSIVPGIAKKAMRAKLGANY
jgi:hypothetical protein